MKKLQSINPSNYEILGEVDISTPEEVAQKVALAKAAQPVWRDLGLSGRIECLKKAMAEMMERKEEYALLQSREMGMTLTESLMGLDGDMVYANWYFDNAEKYLNPETTFESETELHQVFYEPMGVVAIIIPWNFPFANFVWASFQSLLAGNAIVLKHSEECPLCGKFIEEVFTKHLPPGVFHEIYGDGKVGEYLLEQDVQMISFTGSTKTGKHIYEIAGKKFIKAVIELGGSAPGIVFEDADIDAAVSNIVTMRLYNQGQCCDGLKRLIVHESIFNEVVEKLAKAFSEKKVGVAESKDSNIGPLVAKRQLELLFAQFQGSISKGAIVVIGGKAIEGGAYFEPTILTGITKDMRVWNEEVFGPVLPVVPFSSEEEAAALGNETLYGLGSYVYTKDASRAKRLALILQSGMVSVNGTNYCLPQDPFGGYKNSGHGRQHGKYGFAEVTQVKAVAKNK
jgi:acyl-CoA reductase-like NAD-dependent aldehyde dehydrogenase